MMDAKFKIVTLRHVESHWNKLMKKLRDDGIDKNPAIHLKELDFEPIDHFLDAGITDLGEKQALALAELILPYLENIEVVFLSPNRRAFQTFERCMSKLRELGHSKKIDSLIIKVTPYLMPVLSDVIDFPLKYPESKEILSSFNVDFSELDKFYNGKMWFLDFLKQYGEGKPTKLGRINQAIRIYNENKNVKELFHYICDLIPKRIEENDFAKKRLSDFKDYLKENYSSFTNNQILIISHAGTIKRMFGSPTQKNGSCEILEF